MLDHTQDSTGLKRLILSRYYLSLAIEHGKSTREADVFVTINLLHEAVETFLVAAAAHVNATITAKEEFGGYLNKIDAKIEPRELPFRSKLLRLNKARIMAKHDSVVPDRSELPGFIVTIREFLEQASSIVFDINFQAASLIEALLPGPQRDHIQEAQDAFEQRRFADTLIACRKAIYLHYETYYDVKQHNNDTGMSVLSFMSKVPFHARSMDYILKNVHEPVDYIVLDHARIDSELLKDGLDNHRFWNIWRLTPRMYLEDNRWLVRHEPDKVECELLEENASYVLDSTIDHFISVRRVMARQRMAGLKLKTVTVGHGGANLFTKASLNSPIKGNITSGEVIFVDGATEDIDGSGIIFWKVLSSFSSPSQWYYGYVVQDDLYFETVPASGAPPVG